MQFEQLVDTINENCKQENCRDVIPPVAQPFFAINRIGEETPEIRWLACSSVSQPGADCKNTGHSRLKPYSKRQRAVYAAQQVLPYACEDFH
jgi:hypothetical protein